MPIYTKTGDKGETALFGGKRVLKCHELVDVYGSIDELNCWIGLASSKLKAQSSKKLFNTIQNDLFVIGSTLAGWEGDVSELSQHVVLFEKTIDTWEKQLSPLTHFILPGGSEIGALVHVCRATTRKVERQVVAYAEISNFKFQISKHTMAVLIQYLNRLSDLFFVMARIINKKQKKKETIWIGITKK